MFDFITKEKSERNAAEIFEWEGRFPDLHEVVPKTDVLYAVGNTDLLKEDSLYIGIVGTRRASTYGMKAANMFGGHISRRGHCVVSGLAAGIDAAAHQGALARGGRTVGVSAIGVNAVYPLSNRGLFQAMRRHGCILSEHMETVEARGFRFPLRNRIVAAICDVVIVVEAPEKSGALITANIALELGKTVMAVPGSIFSLDSVGSNRLIEDGAFPLCSTRQLDELIDFFMSGKHNIGNAPKIRENQSKREKKEGRRYETLSEESSRILMLLRERRRMSLYDLHSLSDISVTDVMDILNELMNQGIVRQGEGDSFQYNSDIHSDMEDEQR